ncbi:hypothetical protein Tco_0119296, partial [Tanacetum coccineum]
YGEMIVEALASIEDPNGNGLNVKGHKTFSEWSP